MRRVAFVVAVALTGALAVCIAFAAALAWGWQRGWLTREIEVRLAHALGTPVRIGALEGRLMREIALRDVWIGPESAPLLEVQEVALRWGLLQSAQSRELVVDSLRIADAQVTVVRDSDGGWNWDVLGNTESEPASVSWYPALQIRHFALERGRVILRWGNRDARSEIAIGTAAEAHDWRFPRARNGPPSELHFDARVERAEIAPGGLETGRLQLALERTGALSVQGVVEGGFGRVSLEGSGSLAAPSDHAVSELQVELALADLNVGALVGEPALDSRLGGNARLAFAVPSDLAALPRDVRFDLALGPSQLAIGALRSARLRGELAGERWRIDEATADAPSLSFALSGAGIGGTLESLRLDAKTPNLARLAPWIPAELAARGSLAIQAQLEGTFPLPDGHVSLAGSALRLRGAALGQLAAEVSSRDGRITIESLELRGGELPLRAEPGAVLVASDGGIATDALVLRVAAQSFRISGFASRREVRDLELQFDSFDVGAVWGRFAPRALAVGGVLDGRIALDGPLPLPRGSGDLAWLEPRWRTLGADRLDVQLASDSTALRGELHGSGGALGRLDAKVVLPVPTSPDDPVAWRNQPGAMIELFGTGVDLAALKPFLPEQLDRPAGRATLELRAHGSLAAPAAKARLEIANASVHVIPLGRTVAPIRARLAWSDHELRIDALELGIDGSVARASGSIRVPDLRDPLRSNADLRVTTARFAVSSLGVPADDASAALPHGGTLDADLRVRGDLRTPAIAGSLRWNRLRWQRVDIDALAVDLASRSEGIEVRARARYAGSEVLVGRALLPMPAAGAALPEIWLHDPRATFELRGDDLDLALLEPFLPSLLERPRGRARLELFARGAHPEPELTGSLEVSEGSLRVPFLGQTFSPVVGTIRLMQSGLGVEEIRVGEPGHAARLTGHVGLASLRPVDLDLRLDLDRFPLARSSALETDVDGHLAASGAVDAPRLEGELALHDTALTIRRASDPALKELRFVGSNRDGGIAALRERPDRGPDLLARSTVDVGFEVPRGSWVRSDDANFEVEGRVRVAKRALDVWRWTGHASVVRGSYNVQRRRFEVRHGSVELTGGSELDPSLDVEAAHAVGNVTILALLTGRLSAPVLRLESEPAMSQQDVISYLVFGRPASELGSAEQSGVDRAAFAMAAGMAASELQRVLGDQLPFDTLDVRYAQGGAGVVGFGKYVNRDVFVRYGRSLGGETDDEFQVEWRLDERWSVQSTVSRRNSGGDVVFTIEY